ncbi:MAG: GLPGLI family protein [Chitinophagaceae bacterium]|nr:GLPGLI family protein [Chitinophagaceae bacterium]
MKTLITIFCLLFFFCSFSQTSKIKITYLNYWDTIGMNRKKMINTLLIDGTKSVSFSLPDEFKSKGVYQIGTYKNSPAYAYYDETDSIKLYVFKDFTQNAMWFQPNFSLVVRSIKTYVDTLHLFNWLLTNENKKVESSIWKKATMRFRGRNYTAWYDESVPINQGPWKFGGLPGLITEIYDDTYTVYWHITKIEKTEDSLPVFPVNVVETFADFKNFCKEKFSRIKKVMESINNASDPNCKNCTGVTKYVEDNTEELVTKD